jgi:flagellar FliL protein
MKLKRKKKAADGEAPAKGGKGNLVPAVVLALGLLGGGFLFGGKGNAPATAAPAPAPAEEEHPAEEPGPVVPIDPITLNLADQHYLKVGLALQLKAADETAAGGHSGGEADGEAMSEGETAKALDKAIALLTQQTMAQLSHPETRAQVKEQLGEQIGEVYDGEVTAVYFTEFVMQ